MKINKTILFVSSCIKNAHYREGPASCPSLYSTSSSSLHITPSCPLTSSLPPPLPPPFTHFPFSFYTLLIPHFSHKICAATLFYFIFFLFKYIFMFDTHEKYYTSLVREMTVISLPLTSCLPFAPHLLHTHTHTRTRTHIHPGFVFSPRRICSRKGGREPYEYSSLCVRVTSFGSVYV